MVKKKGKSKRTTLKDKYKIQKRTIQTHRKNRKQAKKDTAAGVVVPKKKDPGIPSSWPFKADLLKEIQRTRERQQQLQNQHKEQRTENLRELKKHQASGGSARTMEELARFAAQQKHEFENIQEASTTPSDDHVGSTSLGQPSRRAYLRELKKVVETADVVLQVLDARDPIGTRLSSSVEDAILSHSDKRMVLVLNKIDLIPKEVVSAWLTYLRKSHPTIALQANKLSNSAASAKQKPGGSEQSEGDDNASVVTNTTVATKSSRSSLNSGLDGLLQLLKNYARTGHGSGTKCSKTNIVVGVVGYPNTGKSSILKSLTHCRGSKQNIGVSPRPGFTTSMQEIVLDKQVRLLDSPGVVFDDSNALLNNCVDAESMKDPISAVEVLLKRCTHKSLLLTYNLPNFEPGNVDMFLALMAKKFGRVTKGGIPDKALAARAVLKDWNTGKIPFYTSPPVDEAALQETTASAVIVSTLADDFLRTLDQQVMSEMTDADRKDSLDFLELQPRLERPSQSLEAQLLLGMEDEIYEGEDIENSMDVEESPTQSQLYHADDYDFDLMV